MTHSEAGSGPSLNERLGFAADDRLLIVNCDDLGTTHAANIASYHAMRKGWATSATLMVPCPWARDAARMYMGEDVGVHLTLTSEWDVYRWGPLTHAPSLLDGDGGMPRTIEDVWDHADLDEVRRECRTQIERAILWGFDVTHLDSHMGTLQLRPEFFDVYLEMAVEFRLPLRMAGASAQRVVGFPYRDLAAAEGVVFPDHFVLVPVGGRKTIERVIHELRPGVTEVFLHPSVDCDETRSAQPDWANRIDDYAFLTDGMFETVLARAGVHPISFRALRNLQRG
jgi:chitin disaccharide deacetylase